MQVRFLPGALLSLMLACADADHPQDESGSETAAQPADPSPSMPAPDGFVDVPMNTPVPAGMMSKWSHLDPSKVVPAKLLGEALAYFEANAARIKNQKVLTIIDFSKHSGKKRFFVIDLKTGMVEQQVTAHGSGSDPNNDGVADSFSNVSGSNASSIGFYLAAETYDGKWGRSMRLDGLSSTNSNARARAVVIHGADYVVDGSTQQGRSWGCPALPLGKKDAVIDKLNGGSLIYAALSGTR
jgi:hypothetical protein